MMYLDVLDSVKTAHPQSLSLEWWHPQNETDQNAQLAIVQADIMMRILMGETISLSNNQMIDSYGWLSLAEKVCELDEIVPWAPFNFVYYEKGNPPVTSKTLRKLMIDCLSNEKFEFSAWVNLDGAQKEKMAKNLSGKVPQFETMLNGFSLSLGKVLDERLQQQAEALQRIYEYLAKWERRRKICLTARTSGQLIWPRMEELRNTKDGINGKILDEIRGLVGEDRLEFRSDIYKAIKEMSLNQRNRERLKLYLDRFYNEKLAVSVSAGRGEFTMTDHTPDATIKQDSVEDAVADKSNDPHGLLAQTVYDVYIKDEKNRKKGAKSSYISSLKWADMVQILKEEKDVVKSAKKFQSRVNQYYLLNPESPTFHREYQTWLDKTLEQLSSHREKLAEKLGKKMVFNSRLGKSIIKITPFVEVGAGAVVGAGQFDVSWTSAGVAAIAATAAAKLLSYSSLQLLESRAVGRYRTTLSKSIQVKSDQELLR